jgi:hypothetical protein
MVVTVIMTVIVTPVKTPTNVILTPPTRVIMLVTPMVVIVNLLP